MMPRGSQMTWGILENDPSLFRWRREPLYREGCSNRRGGWYRWHQHEAAFTAHKSAQRVELWFLKKKMHAVCTKIRQHVIGLAQSTKKCTLTMTTGSFGGGRNMPGQQIVRRGPLDKTSDFEVYC